MSKCTSSLIDEINNPVVTLKTIGHPWYFRYEYSDFLKVEFDSYIIYFHLLELIRMGCDLPREICAFFNSL